VLSIERSIAVGACAFFISLITIAFFKRVAEKMRLVDETGADPLKIHSVPTPFVGGFGIALGFFLSFALVFGQLSEGSLGIALIPLLGLGMFALGFCDDRTAVHPVVRLSLELLAGVALALGGFAVPLFNGRWIVPLSITSMALIVVLVLFYVAGAINAINMQDGLDGLAGGVALISCIGFVIVGVLIGHWLSVALALALGGALLAFLLYNFHPASVFMGDNGSYFVGFMLATVSLLLSFAGGTVWCLLGGILMIGAPVFDAAFAIVRRLKRGISPFTGDRSHFYDYLSKRGFSTRAVALISYAIQILLVGTGAILLVR
jgi:UDP-GlcNAc:undecaprenyl-phosphate/decaprenyl-phosphate GlcNAc-1-phosphate transferase